MSRLGEFDRLRDLLGTDLQHIAGASVSGEIPVSESVINRALAEQLSQSGAPLSGLRLEAHEADAMTAYVTLRRPSFVPSLRVMLRVEQQPRLPDAPILGLRWTLAGMGLLTRVAGPALALFNALPPGIHVVGDRLLVDLRRLSESQGVGDLLRYVSRLQIGARAGVVVIRFELRVPVGLAPPVAVDGRR
jgi:hypothetical protein